MSFDIPILLIAYNRPDHLKQALARLKKIRPSTLYVFCDGSKHQKDADVNQVHEIVQSCEWVHKKYISGKNLGCKEGVKTAIDWVFLEEEQAIILEDDIEVHESFFLYAKELLERYSNDDRVGMITGVNLLNHGSFPEYSYFFSKHAAVWGWATWKRSWICFRKTEEYLKHIHKQNRPNLLLARFQAKDKINFAYKSVLGKIDTWDFIWNASFELFGRFCIFPNTNLVVNHGFGASATHTKLKTKLSQLRFKEISWPLRHPPLLCSDFSYDKKIDQSHGRFTLLMQVLRHHVLGL